MSKRKKPKRHWYRQYVGGCPVCGRDKSYRERVYGRRPGRAKRYVLMTEGECYDGCAF